MRNPAIKKYTARGKTKYKFQVYLGQDETGKSVNTTRSGFSSYAQASAEYSRLKAQGMQARAPKKATLDDVWRLWFDTYKPGVKQSSAVATEAKYRLHIQPTFGQSVVSTIKTPAVQLWATDLAKDLVNYKPVIGLLRRLFEFAKRLDYCRTDPVEQIIMPRATSRPRRNTADNFYNKEELAAFLDTAQKLGTKYYTFFLLLASTGVRRGEALALDWSDIDYDRQVIHISKTVATGLDNQLLVQSPKSKAGIRDVPLTAKLAQALQDYHCFESPHVFPNRLGKLCKPSTPQAWLKHVYAANPDLRRITLHGFRHTFASLLIVSDPSIKPKDVQAILGHEKMDITMEIYMHSTEQGKKAVKDALNRLF